MLISSQQFRTALLLVGRVSLLQDSGNGTTQHTIYAPVA